jgi:hypothetical protein
VKMVAIAPARGVATGARRLVPGLLGLLLTTAGTAGTVGAAASADAAAKLPGQFVAKLYTEALGRAPDAGGWSFHLGSFAAQGCTPDAVR